MKAVEIFDVCHGRYKGLRDWLGDSAGSVRSLDWENHRKGITGVPIGRGHANTLPILNASAAARCVVPNGKGG